MFVKKEIILFNVVNSNKITPMKNKDVWNKGSGNQWTK